MSEDYSDVPEAGTGKPVRNSAILRSSEHPLSLEQAELALMQSGRLGGVAKDSKKNETPVLF
jgi:hypothetical protein